MTPLPRPCPMPHQQELQKFLQKNKQDLLPDIQINIVVKETCNSLTTLRQNKVICSKTIIVVKEDPFSLTTMAVMAGLT
jgi:hypothetical protein